MNVNFALQPSVDRKSSDASSLQINHPSSSYNENESFSNIFKECSNDIASILVDSTVVSSSSPQNPPLLNTSVNNITSTTNNIDLNSSGLSNSSNIDLSSSGLSNSNNIDLNSSGLSNSNNIDLNSSNLSNPIDIDDEQNEMDASSVENDFVNTIYDSPNISSLLNQKFLDESTSLQIPNMISINKKNFFSKNNPLKISPQLADANSSLDKTSILSSIPSCDNTEPSQLLQERSLFSNIDEALGKSIDFEYKINSVSKNTDEKYAQSIFLDEGLNNETSLDENQNSDTNILNQIKSGLNCLSGSKHIRLQLKPQGLGNVGINLRIINGKVTLEFRVDNNLVENTLLENITELESILTSSGLLSLDKINIKKRDDNKGLFSLQEKYSKSLKKNKFQITTI